MRGYGLGFILMIVVALLVAWLFIQSMPRSAGTKDSGVDQNAVQQAQDVINQLNDARQQAIDGMEEPEP